MVIRPKASDRILKILISVKNDKLDNISISQRNSKNLCIVDRYWKMVCLKTDISGLKFLVQSRLSEWRTHEKESAEKCLNLEKHQNAEGFPIKTFKKFSKNYLKLRKLNIKNKKLDIIYLLI